MDARILPQNGRLCGLCGYGGLLAGWCGLVRSVSQCGNAIAVCAGCVVATRHTQAQLSERTASPYIDRARFGLHDLGHLLTPLCSECS